MLDPKQLRNDIDALCDLLAQRGFTLQKAQYLELEAARKILQNITQELQAERNQASKQIGILKSKGEDAAPLLKKMEQLGGSLKENEKQLESLQQQILDRSE